MTEAWDVGRLLGRTAEFFEKQGIESGALDAELLLADVLDLSRESLLARRERQITDIELSAYRERVRQRAGSKPISYILNRKEFYSLPFYVDEQVLIPRPETEHLVEHSLKWLESRTAAAVGNPIRVCDIGTGSGCIAASLAKSREDIYIVATEKSVGAAAVAVKNVADLGLLNRIRILACDLFPKDPEPKFDLVVSNPPYLSGAEYESLPPTIRKFEPREALTDGGDGLGVYRQILRQAPDYLRPGGQIFFEISPRGATAMPELLKDTPLKLVSIHHDLADRPRVAEISL